jgi:Ras GTPase-activating-like protein IQGAP2/3
LVRGFLAREQNKEHASHFQQNEEKIVKIQTFFRSKMAKRTYRNFALGENPPLETMKNFVHLLDDGERDFEEELDLERLRQQVVRKIRENHTLENLINQLDLKIALLVKNRISLDEVIKASRKQYTVVGDVALAHSMLKSLDKDSRTRLENYQKLFYLIQTRPTYLARLLFAMNQSAIGDREKRFVETIVLTVFGFAQNTREEYLLLKLFKVGVLLLCMTMCRRASGKKSSILPPQPTLSAATPCSFVWRCITNVAPRNASTCATCCNHW